MDRRSMRRGSLMSALSSIENIHKFVPGTLSRAFSSSYSRDQSDVSDNEEFWPDVMSTDYPVEEFGKNEKWKSVHRAIVSIFHQNALTVFERTTICKNMSDLRRSEIGPYIFDFYQNQLLKRGTKILLNKIEMTTKASAQEELLKIWHALYTEMLPLLQTIFQSLSRRIAATSVQKVTLCAFRDEVVLQLAVDDVIQEAETGEYPPDLVQMLLVLQHYSDPEHPSREMKDLENLVAMVVNPFLGCFTYYDDKDTTENHKPQRKVPQKRTKKATDKDKLQETLKPDFNHSSALLVPAIERLRHEHTSGQNYVLFASSHCEENLLQQPSGYRRHSVQFDLR